jgi:superfamily I DNA and/or RNA helicase
MFSRQRFLFLLECLNSAKKEVRDFDGSYYNMEEVVFITWLLQRLSERGMAAPDIGVITLYKAQARRLSAALLENKSTSLCLC